MTRIKMCNFDFAALQTMDNGKIAALLRRHMTAASIDCQNRPNDKGKRKVTVDFLFSPVPVHDDANECERVDCEIECKSKTPVYRSRVIQMRPHNSGFVFNQDCPEDLDQPSLFPGDEGEEN